MEELRTQVKRAHRRLVLQRFLQASPWFLFTGFMIALVGVAVPKIWTIQVDQNIWLWSWVGGAAAVSLLMSIVWTVATRRGALDAAIELDKRFGLKERVSSTLSLAPDELETEAGQALVNDAIRRVARVDVKEHFRVRTTWRSLLPLVPAVAVFLVALLIADAAQKEKLQAATEKAAEIEAIKKSHDNLRKELKKKQRELEAKGLKDADALFREIDKKLGKIDNKSDVDKKKALIQLKNMEKSLDERRKQVGGANELKKQLQQLKNLEKGPAEELAKAMKNGDFKAAQNALEKLKEQVAKGKLTEKEKEQLIKQMKQMQNQLNQIAQAQQQAMENLKQQIAQKKREGDLAGAGKLQAQLDKLQQKSQMMDKMQQLAQKMGKAQQAMQQGDSKQAAQQLQQMMADFEMLQEEMDEFESLDELLDSLADARDAMNCKNCMGAGCSMCQGQGSGQGQGNGLGDGAGDGERPEEETDTSSYESKVGAKPRAGESVIKGYEKGPNLSGVSRESIKDTILKNVNSDSDPLTDQRLSRDQRDHAIEYFDRIRDE